MNTMKTAITIISGCAALLLTGCMGMTGAKTSEGYYPAASNTSVSVVNSTSGSIDINAWTNDAVGVKALITMNAAGVFAPGDLEDVTITVATNAGIAVSSVLAQDTWAMADLKVNFPKTFVLTNVSTKSGMIDVQNVSGDTTMRGISGHVSVKNHTGNITVRLESGAIYVTGHNGNADVQTVSGSIYVAGTNTFVTATSTAGSIQTKGRGIIAITSQTGSVDCTISALVTNASVKSTTGEVLLRVSRDLNALLDIQTEIGGIDTHDILLTDKNESMVNVVGRKLTAKMGTGGYTIQVRNSVGAVVVRYID
ncbi:MAG: hypothetical protein HZC28_13805 [Spirochaetes bacterium]|nr:hypothetical protein [Spirochaetota bacterium]